MDIQKLFLATAALWVLMHWWLAPRVRRTVPKLIGAEHIPRLAMVSAIEAITRLLLLVSIALGVTNLAVLYVNSLDGINIVDVKAVMDQIESFRDQLSGWSTGLGVFTTALLSAGLVYVSYRSGKKSIEERYNEALLAEIQALAEKSELDSLEPTPAMMEGFGKIQELQAFIDRVGESNPEAAASASEAIHELMGYVQYLDLSRRVNVQVAAEPEDNAPRWIQLLRPVVSRGMINTASAGSAFVAAILTILLVPSFYSIAAPVVADSASQKLIALQGKLEALEISANLERAESEYLGIVVDKDNADVANSAPAWTENDQRLADALGAEFESNAVGYRSFGPIAGSLSRASVRAISRYKVLEARAAASADTARVVSTATAGNVSAIEATLTDIQMVSAESRVPQTEFGRRYSSDLKALALQQPSTWSNISDKAERYFRSFGEVPPPREVRGMLISNSLGNLMGSVDTHSVFGRAAAEALEGVPGDLARQLYEAESKRFTARMVREPNIDSALRSIADMETSPFDDSRLRMIDRASRSYPSLKRVSEGWVQAPPSYQRVVGRSADFTSASKTLERYAQVAGRASMQAGNTEVLAQFADYFPGFPGADAGTPQAKAKARYNRRYAAPSSSLTSRSVVRARSFTRLRGFARVGGVLIGREPLIVKTALDYTRILWREEADGQLTLSLEKESGSTALGRYDPELVALALAYAADGRPTTVTMVTAQPLSELKVLLHPTLEDTGVGCLATRLDQLVDEANSQVATLKALRDNIGKNLELQQGLYWYSWAVRASHIKERGGAALAGLLKRLEFDEVLDEWIDAFSEQGGRIAERALGSELESRRFMREKSVFYDQSLVDLIDACVDGSSIVAYEDCLQNNIPDSISSYLGQDLTWAAPPPTYQPWSGVRESEYTIDDSLRFLRKPTDSDLYPLDFTYQLSFTSPPFFVDSRKPWYTDNEDINAYFDEQPYEFDAYVNQVKAVLSKQNRVDPEIKGILSSMKKFVILQRVFRLAFDGQLGERFATGSMVALAEESSAAIQPVATRRWLSRPGAIEMELLRELSHIGDSQGGGAFPASAVQACIAFIQTFDSSASRAAIAPAEWDKRCLFDEADVGQELARKSEQVSIKRQLRVDMGVVAEDAVLGQAMTCARYY